MNDDVFVHRIALTLIDGVGDVLARQLISYCGSPEGVFREKKKNLERIPDIGPKTAAAIAAFRDFERANRELEFIRKHNIRMFYFHDDDYPYKLKNCYDAPLLLYYKGTADLNHKRMVAIVGTRNATEYGKDFVNTLVASLGEIKAVVVSGLAYGIDIAAHKACLQQGVETIGVVAHGLDRIYPGIHSAVARKMTSQGGLLTEFISGSDPDHKNFPRRNRIIAGLCDAVVVVEAAKKGGALITADLANSYNRDVFALPGRIGDNYSEGCNMLIKSNRAALIQSAQDIRYIMGWDDDQKVQKKIIQQSLFHDMNEEEKTLINFLATSGPSHIDSIMIQSGMPQSKLASLLLKLEFAGCIRCLPGKLFEVI